MAAQVFKVPQDKVDKEMRRKAKVINFGILYGMGVNALRQNLHGTREEAQTFYNEYFDTFTASPTILNEVKAETERSGIYRDIVRPRRYFEGIKSEFLS